MTRQRQILVTVTYNDLGCIIDTKAESYEEPNLQPTCNQLATDFISRQAAIDKLDPLFESLAIDKIKALPSAQQEPHWIPCSVRGAEFPCIACDIFEQIFVPVSVVTIDEKCYDGEDFGFDVGEFLRGRYTGGVRVLPREIIAWMPLPEPYKGGGQNVE